MAQQTIRIGNLEFSVRVSGQDTTFNVLDEPVQPSAVGETPARPAFSRHTRTDNFWGIGFILTEGDYYSTRGGNSINLNIGHMRLNHYARRWASGTTFQYSYYNYRLNANNPVYLWEVLPRAFAKEDINKQVYRSHNLAADIFKRFYMVLPTDRRGNNGFYIDLGVQGDWAFSKYCKIKTNSEGNYKYRNRHLLNSEAFNHFNASAIARLGWRKAWGWGFLNCGTVFARYRFTNALDQSVLPLDLPPITIGIKFGL